MVVSGYASQSAALPRAVVLSTLLAGVAVITEIAVRFSPATWLAPTPCPGWQAADLAGHLRCAADDFTEYFDEAPASRLARLLATGASPQTLARKLARQNAAELAALPEAPPGAHIAAFSHAARAYARRAGADWDRCHHLDHDEPVTVGEMAGAICAEWHLHAWDLAQALGLSYRPAAPEVVLACWHGGLPYATPPPPAPPPLTAADPWRVLLQASGRSPGVAAQLRPATLP